MALRIIFSSSQSRRVSALSATLILFFFIGSAHAQDEKTPSPPPVAVYGRQPSVPASTQASAKGNHSAETYQGRTPHSSGSGAQIGTAIGAAAGGALIIELIAHHESSSPKHFGQDGPSVPHEFDMNDIAIKGLVGPNWPVVFDFMIDTPGAVQIDITASDKRHFQQFIRNEPNHRAYAIFRLPKDFGSKIQTAVVQIRSVALTGPNPVPPRVRAFGLGAGENAVGSVAIDQLTFQPASIHPKIKEVATFGFHAHSAFDGERAEFIFTTLYNGHIIVQKDQEEKLNPVPMDQRASGTWGGQGKPGEHMLQVRAWRGLENGGDWVVAWSPDIVDVVK
jgi:hypothetical protein